MGFFSVFALVVIAISGLARRFGASRWLAFGTPILPLVIWLIYTIASHSVYASEGGAMPYFIFVGILLSIAIPMSLLTVFAVIPK